LIHDTLVSTRIGKPPHLTPGDIDAIGGRIDETGLEEWDVWSGVLDSKREELSSSQPLLIYSTFNKLITVLRSLNLLAHEISDNTTENLRTTSTISALHASHNHQNSPDQLSLTTMKDKVLLPHHFNLHLAFLTVMMSYLIRRHEHFIDGNASGSTLMNLSHFVLQTSQILGNFEQSFGLAIAPPITEHFVSVLQDSYHLLELNPRPNGSVINSSWRSALQIHVSKMVWPIFENLKETLEREAILAEGNIAQHVFRLL
jgi:hypothetical protein